MNFFLSLILTLSSAQSVYPSLEASTDRFLQLFDDGCLGVGLSEYHGSPSDHQFRMALLDNPTLHQKVDVFAVEFASSFHQERLDRWLLDLEDLSDAEISEIWRDTAQFFVWNSPVYEEFLRGVRALNESLPVKDRIRVVGIAPSVDWENASEPDVFVEVFSRGNTMPEYVHSRAMSLGERTIVIVGGHHLLRESVAKQGRIGGMATVLDRYYPNEFCIVSQVWRLDGVAESFAERFNLESNDFRFFYPLQDSGLWNLPTSVIFGEDSDFTVQDVTDAVVYLGYDHEAIEPDPGIYTDEYIAEIQRRASVMYGEEGNFIFQMQMDRVLERREDSD